MYCQSILKHKYTACTITVYAEIFTREIFRGVKFLWLKPPTKIGHHKFFATLLDGKMAAEFRKKAMRAWIPRLQQQIGSWCWKNGGLGKRAEERS